MSKISESKPLRSNFNMIPKGKESLSRSIQPTRTSKETPSEPKNNPLSASHDKSLIGMDSLLWVHMRLFIRDVRNARKDPETNVYYYKSHPIWKLCVCGIVIAREQAASNISYVVDDGTGLLTCVQWTNSEVREPFRLGTLVRAMGRLSEFRLELQLTVDTICEETDPNAEVFHWIQVCHLKKTVYDKPFVIYPELLACLSKTSNLLKDQDGSTDQSDDIDKSESKQMEIQSLIQAIHHYIHSTNSSTFTFQDLFKSPIILQWGNQELERTGISPLPNRTEPSQYLPLVQVLGRTLKSLVLEGIVYLKDAESDLYEIISFENNLRDAVLSILNPSREAGNSHPVADAPQDASLSEDVIILRMRQVFKFRYVPRETILKTVQRLADNGDIFEVEPGYYSASL